MDRSLKVRMIRIVWPVFVETLLFMLISVVDTVMLSRYASDAVGAVGYVNTIINLFNVVFMVITTGTTVICAQYIGAKKPREELHKVVATSMLVNVSIGLVFSLVAIFFGEPLLDAVGVRAEFREYSVTYMQIVGGALFLQAIANTCTATLRAHGRTRLCMSVTIIMNLVNVVGNFFLIFGIGFFPKMGVAGAAIATDIGKLVGVVILLIVVYRSVMRGFTLKTLRPFPKKDMAMVLKLGLPGAMESISYSTSNTCITVLLLNSISAAAVTANTCVRNITTFVYVFSLSIGQGSAIVLGQLIGEKREEDAYKAAFFSLRWALIINVAASVAVMLMSSFLVENLFAPSAAVLTLSVGILYLDVVNEVGRAANHAMINALRAAGDVKYPAIVSILSMWIFGVGFGALFSKVFGWGIYGVWVGMAMDECIRGGLCLWRWVRKKWIGKAVI